jgi:cell division control protein 12
LVDSGDEEMADLQRSISEAMPLSVIASQETVHLNGKLVRGREYSWGVAEVENEEHCDFVKLRNLLIRTNMHDLVVKTNDVFYESYRSNALSNRGFSDQDPHSITKKLLADKMKIDEETLRKSFLEQVKLEENRFKQWEQRVFY